MLHVIIDLDLCFMLMSMSEFMFLHSQRPHDLGSLGVEFENMKGYLSDTGADLFEDIKFLVDVDEQSATKNADWECRSKLQTEEVQEVLALSDTRTRKLWLTWMSSMPQRLLTGSPGARFKPRNCWPRQTPLKD